MTDRTAGSVHLMADGPSGSSTLDSGKTDTVDTDTTGSDTDANTDTDTGGNSGTDISTDSNSGTGAATRADGGTESGTEISAVNGTAESVGVTDTNDAKAADVTAETVALDPAADVADTIVDHEVPEAPSVDGKSAEATAETTVVPATDTDDTPGTTDTEAAEDAPQHDRPAEVATETREFESEEAEPPRRVADVAHGTRFAGRYRLEDKLSSNGKSATWRAVDEKLRRAVGIHLVAAGSEHARSVMAAARAAALVGDPRFVQVLDAAEEDGLVYVVKEWLPDADNLASLLATNPLPPHEAYEMARSVSDAMAVAHRAGLSHLRLDPDNVLRMHTGQYKIVGLSVEAALYGHDTTDAARDDTRAIGSLLYACLARRWPDAAAYGLPQAPRNGDKLCTPGQVKAHVHMPLEAIAMRALGQEYKHQAPFEAPEDVVAALAAIPTVLPPEPEPPVSAAGAEFDDEYTPTALLSRGSSGYNGGPPRAVATRSPAGPPPALGGGFGRFVKSIVAVIVLVAIVLATWQIAVHVNKDRDEQPAPTPTPSSSPQTSAAPAAAPPQTGQPIAVSGAKQFSLTPSGGAASDYPENVGLSFDGKPGTSWRPQSYVDGPEAKIRMGIGIIYDLGSVQDLRTARIQLAGDGDHTTLAIYAADPGASSFPTRLDGFSPIKEATTQGDEVTFTFEARTRFVLVWMTAMPMQRGDGQPFYSSGYQNGFAEVGFTS
ncbi:protein kinase family protein [Streptodolium elevatio]|uniref:Protein kinase family protein n=1 Tax=Streptodolium elevatio TaxID=3157996 RepID=A0ABV3DSG9_9ACTN